MTTSLGETAVRRAVALAESGRVPDRLVRSGMHRVVAARARKERRRPPRERADFWNEARRGPVAVHTDTANQQHYEVPASFFDIVLGPAGKYSSAYWPEGVTGLAEAEEAMLRLTAERAGIEDGGHLLDLGCGWGSFTLWAARRHPGLQITAVSNSTGQRRHIEGIAGREGLTNIEVVTADVADFEPDRRFDRIVSVEMLEHVRNHPELFGRMRRWLEPEGAVFVHVFAHREYAYPFEAEGPASWMAETFFTGGVMPSRRLLPESAQPHFELDGDWWLDGTHYARTLDAWLDRFDANRDAVREILLPVYGNDTATWMQRWRMFFMACAEMFAYDAGRQWGVAHHRFVPAG